jgi:uncharacterized protein involved in exopolysaccharide biosynthesis
MDEQQDNRDDDDGGGGINLEVVRSYMAFAGRALKARKPLFIGLLVVGLALTITIAKYLPRTYSCTTVLMTVSNAVLDSDRGPNPLTGAQGLIMRHENLEALIKDTDLKKKYWARRPALLGVKDDLIKAVFGEMDDRTLTAVLVGTLESRLSVEVEDREDTLTISVDWSDPATCAELAEAAKERFLKIRHKAEISAFQEKMGILDTHASKMREEIDTLAAQIKADLQAKQQQRAAEYGKANAAAGAGKPAPVAMPRLVAPSKPVTDEQLPELRERLTSLKARLSGAENDRQARMRDEQGKLAELKLRFTPNHPQVITQEERVGMVSQVSSELALMRSEVGDLESQIRQREAMMKTGSAAGTPGAAGRAAASDSTTSAALPYDILTLLDEKDADPAMSAQISGAVVRYGSLRDDVRGAKLALDTAQAAFNHRYQVVIPVEAPSKPIKPKVPMVVGIGLFLSLLVALLVPILLELRRDVLVERWQVDHFQLPVLAELRLPEKREE